MANRLPVRLTTTDPIRRHSIVKKKFRNVEDRFWEKVDVRGPDDCWIWIASINQGYGSFNIGHGNILSSHVASYIIHY